MHPRGPGWARGRRRAPARRRGRFRQRADQPPEEGVGEGLADVGVDVAGQQRGDDHQQREQERAAGGHAEPETEARALDARQLRAGEVERGEGGNEREQPGRDPARALEDVEQRVVLEPGEDELDHLPERLLDIAGVGAEEADQRRVGQRREHEADHEHDRERPDPDDAGGDDRRRLPQLPELPDELGLGGRAGPRGGRFRSRAARLRAPARIAARAPVRSARAPARPPGARAPRGAALQRAVQAPPVAAPERGAPQFGQKRARSSSRWPHWSQNAIPAGSLAGPSAGRRSGRASVRQRQSQGSADRRRNGVVCRAPAEGESQHA